MIINQILRVLGGSESQVVIGNSTYTVQNGMKAFALTCRVTGTVILSITVQDEFGGYPRPYVPTWAGVLLNQGDYFVSLFPILSITLTLPADSVTLHCDKTF